MGAGVLVYLTTPHDFRSRYHDHWSFELLFWRASEHRAWGFERSIKPPEHNNAACTHYDYVKRIESPGRVHPTTNNYLLFFAPTAECQS